MLRRGGPSQGQLYNMIIYDTNTSYIKYCTLAIIAEFRRPEGPPSGAPYPYRKLKVLLAVLLGGQGHEGTGT